MVLSVMSFHVFYVVQLLVSHRQVTWQYTAVFVLISTSHCMLRSVKYALVYEGCTHTHKVELKWGYKCPERQCTLCSLKAQGGIFLELHSFFLQNFVSADSLQGQKDTFARPPIEPATVITYENVALCSSLLLTMYLIFTCRYLNNFLQ